MLMQFSCVEVYYLVGLWLQPYTGKGFFRTGAISLLYFQGKERNPHLPLNSFTSVTHSSISLSPWISVHDFLGEKKQSAKSFFGIVCILLEIRNRIAMVSCCFDCQSFIHYFSGNRILVLLEVNCPCLWASHSGFLWTHLTAWMQREARDPGLTNHCCPFPWPQWLAQKWTCDPSRANGSHFCVFMQAARKQSSLFLWELSS